MKPLDTSQRVLTWLCLLPPKENTKEWEKRSYVALVITVTVGAVALFSSSLAFVLKFRTINFQDTSNALCTTVGSFPMSNSIIVAFLFRHQIPSVFEKISDIYEKYKDDDTFRFLARANKQSEWYWETYIKFIIIGLLANFSVSSVASVLLCWLWEGHFDSTLAFHPYRFVLPWDQSTLVGYFGEIIYSIVVAESFILYDGAFLITFVSICLHHQAFSEMLHHKLCKLEHPDEKRNEKEYLCEIVDFHNKIKDWFLATAEVYSPHLLAELVCNMLLVAIFLFQLDQQITKELNISGFVFSLFCISLQFANLFLSCFFGKMASESYEHVDNSYFDCNWHELPSDLQKYFIMMIANAQIPLKYRGSGLMTLDLETFSSLMKTVLTYYMVFKTLSTE